MARQTFLELISMAMALLEYMYYIVEL